MKILTAFSLRATSTFLVVAMLVFGMVVIGGALFLRYESSHVSAAWTSFQVNLSERGRLLGTLKAYLGYGGMIHNYKNFILRKKPEYAEQALDDLASARTIIKQYEKLPLNEAERAALQDIRATLATYDRNLATAAIRVRSGKSAAAMDIDLTVDDTLAVRGLTVLDDSISRKIDQYGVGNTKQLALSTIRSALGYGGMIHAYKNYVLRLDDAYKKRAIDAIDRVTLAIGDYHNLGVNSAERLALDDLAGVLKKYRNGIAGTSLSKAVGHRVSPEEHDRRVTVNDAPALRGLRILETQVQSQFLAAADQVDNALLFVRWTSDSMILVTILAVLALALLFVSLIRLRVMKPISSLAQDMKALSDGDHKRYIHTDEFPDEIKGMAQAVVEFKKNAIRMDDVEQQLSETNDQLNQQVITMQDTTERADAQTAQALGLAEGMAMARADAEKAMARAESDEQRIRAVVNAVTDAIIVIDAHGIIESFNYAAELMFGYTADEALGRNVKLLMPEPHKTHHDEYLTSYLDGKGADVGGARRELEAVRRNGKVFPIELSVRQMRLGGKTMFTGAIRDITERKRAEEQIRRMALTDSLTGLANRNLFNSKLEEGLTMAKREGWLVALMMLDLDKFKPVNDTYGHPTGDALLQQVSVRLKKLSRDTDTVARLGGDEFAIVVVNPDSREDAIKPAKRIVDELTRPFHVLDNEVKIGTSIGIAFYPDDADTDENLIQKADKALYVAKEAGRNTYRVYSDAADDPEKQGDG